MSIRRATHAGSWYIDRADNLNNELSRWLNDAQPSADNDFTFPVKGCKAIIAPHAGYSYSGPAAAWAYKSIDTTGIKRVFILGPSHHLYLDGCALSRCEEYATPIGNLPLDLETIEELRKTGSFEDMSQETDEDEHSIEMHLPYVRKVFEGIDIKVVPILVGAISKKSEQDFGKLLAPYLAHEDTFCVVSSDFCHWGLRFQYTFYYPSPPDESRPVGESGIRLLRSNASSSLSHDFDIHESITVLDHQAMEILTLPPSSAKGSHDAFALYLARTKNTICGRHPIGVLLGALSVVENGDAGNAGTDGGPKTATINWNAKITLQNNLAPCDLVLVRVKFALFLFASFVCTLSAGRLGSAANSFAGSNLYYAAGLLPSVRETLLQGLEDAGMKVLRVWLDGQSSATTKGTTITKYPSLEPNEIGVFDDTVLDFLDDFMVEAQKHRIKLMISMHSFNALQGGDVYGALYGTGFFYEWENATSQFDARLRHVLNHVHHTLSQPWKELSDYIFAFEAENEAMIGQEYIQDNQVWQCDRANTIKSELGDNNGILITTGGESFLDESVQPDWLACDALVIVAIHAYGVGDFDTSKIQGAVSQAQAAGKKLIFQEWGACYYTTENNNCPTGNALDTATRNNNIQTWAKQITAAGMPWTYWQIIPNEDPHFGSDFEIGVDVDPSWDTLKQASLAALDAPAAFDFSNFLL